MHSRKLIPYSIIEWSKIRIKFNQSSYDTDDDDDDDDDHFDGDSNKTKCNKTRN